MQMMDFEMVLQIDGENTQNNNSIAYMPRITDLPTNPNQEEEIAEPIVTSEYTVEAPPDSPEASIPVKKNEYTTGLSLYMNKMTLKRNREEEEVMEHKRLQPTEGYQNISDTKDGRNRGQARKNPKVKAKRDSKKTEERRRRLMDKNCEQIPDPKKENEPQGSGGCPSTQLVRIVRVWRLP